MFVYSKSRAKSIALNFPNQHLMTLTGIFLGYFILGWWSWGGDFCGFCSKALQYFATISF